jgi:hypothetical protein
MRLPADWIFYSPDIHRSTFSIKTKEVFKEVKITAGVQPGGSKTEETGGKDESKRNDCKGRALS